MLKLTLKYEQLKSVGEWGVDMGSGRVCCRDTQSLSPCHRSWNEVVPEPCTSLKVVATPSQCKKKKKILDKVDAHERTHILISDNDYYYKMHGHNYRFASLIQELSAHSDVGSNQQCFPSKTHSGMLVGFELKPIACAQTSSSIVVPSSQLLQQRFRPLSSQQLMFE